ncbi:MAG: ArsR family transcriptional regulator [Desulfurococcales archaeon]|nr:ArsR family transcriptional regulator [Desulfurococcales archaeon]
MPSSVEPLKEGIREENNTLYVVGARHIAKVANALANDTRAKILEMLSDGPKDLDDIAEEMNQSKANISSQIRRLEAVNIVKSAYRPGQRGIKKVVELNVDKIVMILKPEK